MGWGREDGFTFNELLAAMGIVVVAVMGYSLSSINLFRRQTISDNSTVAIHLAQDKIEQLLSRRPLAEASVCPDGGDHGLSAKAGIAGVFNRCWIIGGSSLGSDLKQIDVIVSWRDQQAHELRLTTLVFTGE